MSATSLPTIDGKELRNALGNFATGITVITARSDNGETIGITANSFNSLSIDPPLILWSLDKRSLSYPIFSVVKYFSINVLASDQMDISNHFATQQKDKFSSIDYEAGLGGAPLLKGCVARFQCSTKDIIDAGDHWLFIAQVEAFDTHTKSPLCYHKGSYSMLSPHPVTIKPGGTAKQNARGNTKQLNNNILYLMLTAVQAYQQNYTPRQEALGLNSMAARIIMNISDREPMNIRMLTEYLPAPIIDIEANLLTLESEGYLEISDDKKYLLTDKGQHQAARYWALVNQYQTELLNEYSEDEISAYKKILQGIS